MKNLIVNAIDVHNFPDTLPFAQKPRMVYHGELVAGGSDPTNILESVARRIDAETSPLVDIVVDLEWIGSHPTWIQMDPAKSGRDAVARTLDRFRTWRSWFPRHAEAGKLSFWYLGVPNETYPFMQWEPVKCTWRVSDRYERAFEDLFSLGAHQITDRMVFDVYRRPDWDDRYTAWQAMTIDYAKRFGKPVMVAHSPLRPNVFPGESITPAMFEADIRSAARRLTISRGDRIAIWIPWTKQVRNEETFEIEEVRRDWNEVECCGDTIRKLLGVPPLSSTPAPAEVSA